MMLATWLVEIFLNKWNAVEDLLAIESANTDMDSLTIERQITEEDLKGLMVTYQVGDINAPKTTRQKLRAKNYSTDLSL